MPFVFFCFFFPFILIGGFVVVGIAIMILTESRKDRLKLMVGCCRRCGYNLTGNLSGRCPECGKEIPGRQHEKGAGMTITDVQGQVPKGGTRLLRRAVWTLVTIWVALQSFLVLGGENIDW